MQFKSLTTNFRALILYIFKKKNCQPHFVQQKYYYFCIRRMKEGNIFSLSTLVCGGGVPHLRSGRGGIPSQVWMGVPHSRSGQMVPPSHVWMWGYLDLHPGQVQCQEGGYPAVSIHPDKVPGQDGGEEGYSRVPPVQDWMGYPHWETEQHSEYLL